MTTTEGEAVTDFYVFADKTPQTDPEDPEYGEFIQLSERAASLALLEGFEADDAFKEAAEYATAIDRPVALYKVTFVRDFEPKEKEEQND